MSVDLTSQFVFPKDALSDFADRGGPKLRQSNVGGVGVQQYEIGEFDKGIPYEFFVHQSKNQVQSEQFDIELNDDVEMVRWIVKPRELEPTCRLTDLPQELLKFRRVFSHKNADGINVMKWFRDENGDLECTGGKWKDAYMRWKNGQRAPGLPLSKWDKISPSEMKTLASEGFFSVEQLASTPEDRIVSRFPKRYHEIYRDAVQKVNAMNPSTSLGEIKKYADQLLAEQQKSAQLESQLSAVLSRLEALEATPKKKQGRPKKSEAQPAN